MRKELFVYDLDGTLIDTGEDIAGAVNAMLKVLERPPLNRKTIDAFVGLGLHPLITGCLQDDDPDLFERGSRIYRNHYREHLLDHSRPYPQAEDFLKRFQDRRQMVMTNKPNPFTDQMIKFFGLEKYFFRIVAGNSGFPKKPDPQALVEILKDLGLTSQEAVFIGDSLTDIETARAAGVEAVVLTHGFTDKKTLGKAQPEGIFSNYEELMEYAYRQGW